MPRTIIASLLLLGLAHAAQTWTYSTPARDFEVTLPVQAADDVQTFNLGTVKRTGFFVDSVLEKTRKLFVEAGCTEIRELGVWSEPYRDDASYEKFVRFKFGGPSQGERRSSVKLGSYTGIRLDRDFKDYKGVRTFHRVVGVHTPTWQHSFYCDWHQKADLPAVRMFFESIRAVP